MIVRCIGFLINNELLKELEVEFRPYRYLSCSEAELEYLKNELAKIKSDTNESDKIEIEKRIKQIEQELKGTYIREDETDEEIRNLYKENFWFIRKREL